ncbi:MAG: signal peptidase I [Bacilli bacterium]|nr:signal peptidase I [Bacilli bacterium]
MSANLEIENSFNNIFGVKHYNVKIIKKKENFFKYAISVLSYALFIWLLLIGGTLLLYVADIKIRAAKGDYSAPVFNAYVVLSGSMLPEIAVKDIVVTKKVPAEELEIGDIITFISPDTRYGGISITHRILDKKYDESLGSYTYRTKGDNNNVADTALVPNTNILGKVILKVPKLGYIQDLLSSKGGLIIIVLIPCLVILSYDIMKIFKNIGKKTKLIKE